MTIDLSTTWTVLLAIAAVWELVWKGIALWRAAQLDQSAWFMVMLVVSSVGILPIVYLLSHHEYGHGHAASRGLA